jgi:hypothetical protein
VPGDTNGIADVFVRDLAQGTTIRASVSSSGEEQSPSANANGARLHAMSSNGRFVTFRSNASNLVPGDTNGAADMFVKIL